MYFIFIFVFLTSSLAAIIRPRNKRPVDAIDGDNCNIILERKTLNWNFLSANNSKPDPVNRYELTAPGAGYVWRGEDFHHPDVSRPILFQRTQGWSLVNCTSYFPENHPARGACTSPDVALLSTPGTKTGDGPPDKGIVGTIQGSKYPELSLWAIYNLIELRLTPIVPEIYYDKLITVEVFGWRENGTETKTIRIKIKGSEVGYKVEFPKDEWNTIIQWQVRVWWSAGSRPTRENFEFLIDDVVIDEYAFESNYYNCKYPIQLPTGPLGSVVTMGFDDIFKDPNSSAAVFLPDPYHDYSFAKGNGSTWKVVNKLSFPDGSPGRLTSASTGQNGLLGTPRVRGRWYHDPNVITSTDFFFDLESFHVSVDNTTTSTDDPRNIFVIVSAVGACTVNFVYSYDEGAYILTESKSFSFYVDLTSGGFKKYRAVSIKVMDYDTFQFIPFWIDDIKVRSWKGALDLPGCERCGDDMKAWCEYPPIERPRTGIEGWP